MFIQTLALLASLLERDNGLGSHVFRTLASDDVYEGSLVQQCHSLEQQIGTGYLQLCLENPTDACSIIVHDAKEASLANNWICTLQDSRFQPSLAVVLATNAWDCCTSSWNSSYSNIMCDEALEYGIGLYMQGLFGALAKHSETKYALTAILPSLTHTRNT